MRRSLHSYGRLNASSMLSNKLASCAQQARCLWFAITVTDYSKLPGMAHLAAFLQREGPAYFTEQAEREKMQKRWVSSCTINTCRAKGRGKAGTQDEVAGPLTEWRRTNVGLNILVTSGTGWW